MWVVTPLHCDPGLNHKKMGKLISFVILIIDIIAIADIVKSNKSTEKKVLWIIAVVLLPILGPVLYYFMGRKNS